MFRDNVQRKSIEISKIENDTIWFDEHIIYNNILYSALDFRLEEEIGRAYFILYKRYIDYTT